MMRKKYLIVQIFDCVRVINHHDLPKTNKDLTIDGSYCGLVLIFQPSYTLAYTLSSGVRVMEKTQPKASPVTAVPTLKKMQFKLPIFRPFFF